MKNIFLYPFGLSFYECEQYTKTYAKSFYFSSFLLPKGKRLAAYAVYSFCRYADNLIDIAEKKSIKDITDQFSRLKNDLSTIYQNRNVHKHCAFTKTVLKYQIPQEYFLELIEGVLMDIEKNRYNTVQELDLYCYKVASTVGLIMCEVFGYTNTAAHCYAITLGKAMQLTNIIRDIDEDFRLGRIYIPQDILKQFNYNEKDIREKVINDNYTEMMKYLILHTRSQYSVAEYGISYLTDDGSRTTAVIMLKIYSAILDKIEKKNYDIYSRRNYVTSLEKLKIIASYVFNPFEKVRLARLKEEIKQGHYLT